MNYELKINYNNPYKKEQTLLFYELKKAKDNLSLVKNDKEKDILIKHVRSLRKQLKKYEVNTICFELKKTNKQHINISCKNAISNYDELHKKIKISKRQLNERLRSFRITRRNFNFNVKSIRNVSRKMIDGVSLEKGSISKIYLQKKIMEIKSEKKPTNFENHIGIEIEFASILSENEIGRLFFEAGLTNYIQLMEEYTDGKHSNEHGYEISIVAPEKDIFEIVKKTCKVLNEKIDANVTYGCGLHVHIDCRNRNQFKVFNNLFNTQEILYSMVSPIRRTNRHVKILPEKIMFPNVEGTDVWACHECSDFANDIYINDCGCEPESAVRYFGINGWAYKHHGTIEVRIHSGTTNATKISNWIKLLLAIADNSNITKEIVTTDVLFKTIKLNEDLKDYVTKRIETFTK